MHPPFIEPAEFVLQEEDVFLQLFRDRSISAWAYRTDAGNWEPVCPELDAKEFTVSVKRLSPREATSRVLNMECEEPLQENGPPASDFDWLKAHIENHIGRHAVEDRLVAKYLSIFPSTIIHNVTAFPSRQWEVLAAVGRNSALLDLLETNPALFYLAAITGPGVNQDETLLDAVGNRPRREICGDLGLPSTASMVRILGKVRPEFCSPELLDSLLVTTADNHKRNLLQHLPRLTLSSLLIMATERASRLVSDDFYFEVAEMRTGQRLSEALSSFSTLRNAAADQLERYHPRPGGICDLIEGAKRVVRGEQPPPPPRKWPTQEELLAIRAAEDEAGAREFRSGQPTHIPAAPTFPLPPFPPPHGSLAITDGGMLAEEAQKQKNCVIEYESALATGRCVLFRMLIPERATVEIIKDGGSWKLGQVKRARNLPVLPETLSFVYGWFQKSMSDLMIAKAINNQRIAATPQAPGSLTQSTFELF